MEEKLKLIDEISTLVVGMDLDIYLQNEDIHEKVCISDATAKITEKLFKLTQLIKKDNHGK